MGIRIIKTAISVMVAMFVAEWLSLDFAMTAGLFAILGVDVTKRKTLLNSFKRIVSTILGLILAVAIFTLIGFHIWALGLFICIAYPILTKVKLKDGIITSSVVVLHVYSVGTATLPVILNEIWLLLVGFISAAILNLVYMPNTDKRLVQSRAEVERLFAVIFNKIAMHLKDPSYIWDGKEVIEVEQWIQRGKKLAVQANENNLFRSDSEWQSYFRTCEQQLDSIKRMLVLVAQVYDTLKQGEYLAEVFHDLSEEILNENKKGNTMQHLLELKEKYRQMPLPSTREEFEVRSALLQLSEELKHYLGL